jgi:hypothetical protein
MTTNELICLFFTDLKKYNVTNFNHLLNADLVNHPNDPVALKSFSSVITRFLIFREKHPEVTRDEGQLLYYKLKLDMISRYFSQLPDGSPEDLIAFQKELKEFVTEHRQLVSGITPVTSTKKVQV